MAKVKKKMKHILNVAITVLFILLMLVGCAKVEEVGKAPEPKTLSRFVEVERTTIWRIVVDKETGVMYTVSFGGYNAGTFTLLVDADGKPLLWKKGGERSE